MTSTPAARSRTAVIVDLTLGTVFAVASTVVLVAVLHRFDTLVGLEAICLGMPAAGTHCTPSFLHDTLLAGRLVSVIAWTLGIAGVVGQAVRHRTAWPWALVATALQLAALFGVTLAIETAYLP